MKWQVLASAAALALTAACSGEPPPGGQAAKGTVETTLAKGPDIHAAPLAVPPLPASTSAEAQAVDAATYVEGAAGPEAARRMLIRVQVLLDRAHFSPGVIDGKPGENVRQAIAAFEQAHGLTVDGKLDPEVWAALMSADPAPAMRDYVISQEDLAGPFVAKIPTEYAEMAKLETLAYANPLEMLAERFHMDEALLKALNPQADFSKAGTTIVVSQVGEDRLPAPVVRIEIDKAEREVRAYGEGEKLLAVYPATVGSAERPAPSGEWAVRTVATAPTWSYDPKRLTFGKKTDTMTIAAGPNNPVGSTWIDLTKDTYGIHGSPDPRRVGKADSHGCVRLTNWDIMELGSAVKAGAPVVFVGAETKVGKTKT
jgi:lipoprotein-anchoring transpeptidase ErfK/SrfK